MDNLQIYTLSSTVSNVAVYLSRKTKDITEISPIERSYSFAVKHRYISHFVKPSASFKFQVDLSVSNNYLHYFEFARFMFMYPIYRTSNHLSTYTKSFDYKELQFLVWSMAVSLKYRSF